jgi:hypothetical protein
LQASSEWLTILIAKMWPYVSKAVEAEVVRMVPGIIAAAKPKWMEGIEIKKFHLGEASPKITFINVDEHNEDEVDDIRMEIGFDWKSTVRACVCVVVVGLGLTGSQRFVCVCVWGGEPSGFG